MTDQPKEPIADRLKAVADFIERDGFFSHAQTLRDCESEIRATLEVFEREQDASLDFIFKGIHLVGVNKKLKAEVESLQFELAELRATMWTDDDMKYAHRQGKNDTINALGTYNFDKRIKTAEEFIADLKSKKGR